jgi:hypothetical protein
MTIIRHHTCPNCGTKVNIPVNAGDVIACETCEQAFRIPQSFTPAPPAGYPISRVNFRRKSYPGWKMLNEDKLTFEKGELIATFPKEDLFYPVMRTYSIYEDFDVSVGIRFLKGNRDHIHAGLEIRSGSHGDYVVSISPQQTFRIGYHIGTDWGGNLSSWRTHNALKEGFDVDNHLRIIGKGTQIRVYLNGVFAAEIQDDRFPSGRIRLVLVPKKKRTVIAFRQLELREA